MLEIAAEIEREEQEKAKKREERQAKEQAKREANETKKLGRLTYHEPSKINEVVLQDEVPKALRVAAVKYDRVFTYYCSEALLILV